MDISQDNKYCRDPIHIYQVFDISLFDWITGQLPLCNWPACCELIHDWLSPQKLGCDWRRERMVSWNLDVNKSQTGCLLAVWATCCREERGDYWQPQGEWRMDSSRKNGRLLVKREKQSYLCRVIGMVVHQFSARCRSLKKIMNKRELSYNKSCVVIAYWCVVGCVRCHGRLQRLSLVSGASLEYSGRSYPNMTITGFRRFHSTL